MHIYEKDFRELYDKQPDNLSHLEKLLRMDKLACIETQLNVEIKKDTNSEWFFILSTILTELYLQQVPAVKDYEYLPDIVTEHARRYTSKLREATNHEPEAPNTLVYLQMRRGLIEHIKSLSH